MWPHQYELIPIHRNGNSIARGLICGITCGVLGVALAALLLVTMTLMNQVYDGKSVFSISLVPEWYEWTRRVFWIVGVIFSCAGFTEFAPGKSFGVGSTKSYSFLMTLLVLNFFGWLFSWMMITALTEIDEWDIRLIISAVYLSLAVVLTVWRFQETARYR